MSTLQPTKAQLPHLQAATTPHAALQTVLTETVRQLQANVPGVLGSEDREFVHQARVALRRLRSAQKAFKPIALNVDWRSLTVDIQWLAGLLGQVRDLDVLLTETLPRIETAIASEADFAALRNVLSIGREQCRAQLRSALQSARYKALLHKLRQRQYQLDTEPPAYAMTLRAFARQSLHTRWRQVDRLARHWQTLDSERRHDLRKHAKKLRYTAEFFAALFKRKKIERYLEKLQKLQGALGSMNDANSARSLLKKVIASNISVAHTAGLALGWLSATAPNFENKGKKAIEKMEKAKPFW
jgi:CHAD domain-containing protein